MKNINITDKEAKYAANLDLLYADLEKAFADINSDNFLSYLKRTEEIFINNIVISDLKALANDIFELNNQNASVPDLHMFACKYIMYDIKPLYTIFSYYYPDQLKKVEKLIHKKATELSGVSYSNSLTRKKKDTAYPMAIAKHPENYLLPIDKVSSTIFFADEQYKDIPYAQDIAINVAPKSSKDEVNALLRLDYEEIIDNSDNIKMSKKLVPYDREVQNAVISLYVKGNEYITSPMIFRTLTGKNNINPASTSLKMIDESVRKMIKTYIIMDLTEEIEKHKRHFVNMEEFKYEGHILSAEVATGVLNGQKVSCYHILREPILYSYSQSKKQIVSVPMKLLNSPINNTDDNIMLRGYLIERVITMKRNAKVSRYILFETIYALFSMNHYTSDSGRRKKKMHIRNSVEKILLYWAENDFIAGYSIEMNGQTARGLTIDL